MTLNIINIIEINGYNVTVFYNTGEYRIIDFKKIKENPQNDFDKKITPNILKSIFLSNGSISFKKIKYSFTLAGKRKYTHYAIGGDTLYNESKKANIYIPIGTKIKNLRLQHKLTQKQLSEKVKITPSHLSIIETNKNMPNIKTLKKIAKIFKKRLKIDFAN